MKTQGYYIKSTQQLRVLWSNVITNLIGITIPSIAIIWSFFVNSYVASNNPTYMILPAFLSFLIIGFWRLYTRYLDNSIASLYPDFMLCGHAMGAPIDHFTTGYFASGKVRNVELIINTSELTPKQKRYAISRLIQLKRIGTRGHFAFDCFAMLLDVIIFAVVVITTWNYVNTLHIWTIILILGGLLLVGLGPIMYGMYHYQRDPQKRLVKEMINEAKEIPQ